MEILVVESDTLKAIDVSLLQDDFYTVLLDRKNKNTFFIMKITT